MVIASCEIATGWWFNSNEERGGDYDDDMASLQSKRLTHLLVMQICGRAVVSSPPSSWDNFLRADLKLVAKCVT